jgi:hypothetical protein
MTENRLVAGWLRSITALAAVAGTLGLSACGGGSGAPNNPFLGPLTVLPNAVVAYSGVPTTLTISGGTGPYKAFSSNSAVLPVPQTVPGTTVLLLANNVNVDTDVTINIQETGTVQPVGVQVPVTVTVRAAPLLNSLTITPNLADCGTGAICSGQNGTASVTVLGPQGASLAGRAVRFDVLGTAYAIATNNPAQPFVSSLVVVSDANGVASVIIKANVSAATQFVQMRATDLTSGQQLTGNFIIQQITDGSKILTVVPDNAKITGAFKGQCSTGFATDYYIYGGTPPYRVTSTFPNSITLLSSTVNTNGGFFRAVTNGSCVDPLTFSILDATGRQTTTKLSNVEGTEDAPKVETVAVTVEPKTVKDAACSNKTFNFVIVGGLPPYNVRPTAGTALPQTVATNGGSTSISGLATGSGSTSIVFLDSSVPQKTTTATITCDPATVTELSASPGSYTSTACTGTPFSFAVFGGTPPYNVTTTLGTATPTVVPTSGGITTITGLNTGSGVTSVVFLDSSSPQKTFSGTVTCTTPP